GRRRRVEPEPSSPGPSTPPPSDLDGPKRQGEVVVVEGGDEFQHARAGVLVPQVASQVDEQLLAVGVVLGVDAVPVDAQALGVHEADELGAEAGNPRQDHRNRVPLRPARRLEAEVLVPRFPGALAGDHRCAPWKETQRWQTGQTPNTSDTGPLTRPT